MKVTLVILAVLLSSCSVKVTDSRISREEISQAFAQRDQVLASIAKEIKTLKEAKSSK